MPISPRLYLLFAIGLAGGVWWFLHREIVRAPGVLVPDAPLQVMLDHSELHYTQGKFSIHPLATFSISARVLSRADYHWDSMSDIIPSDLALGWGRMSDSTVLDQVDVSQGNRYFYVQVRHWPIPRDELMQSSANMHLIAADPVIARRIAGARVGDVVRFDGFLVEVNRADGWHIASSLRRDDEGAGACEVVYVEHFEIARR